MGMGWQLNSAFLHASYSNAKLLSGCWTGSCAFVRMQLRRIRPSQVKKRRTHSLVLKKIL